MEPRGPRSRSDDPTVEVGKIKNVSVEVLKVPPGSVFTHFLRG